MPSSRDSFRRNRVAPVCKHYRNTGIAPNAPESTYRNIPLEISIPPMGRSKAMKPLTLRSRPLRTMRNFFPVTVLLSTLPLINACGGSSGSGGGQDPPPSTLTILTSSLPTGQTGVAYNASLTAAGGTPPYAWSLTSGTLPPNLTLTMGGIAGMPTQVVTNTPLTLQVTDSATPQRSKSTRLGLT